jgi:hypothetical protein
MRLDQARPGDALAIRFSYVEDGDDAPFLHVDIAIVDVDVTLRTPARFRAAVERTLDRDLTERLVGVEEPARSAERRAHAQRLRLLAARGERFRGVIAKLYPFGDPGCPLDVAAQ